MPLPEPHDIQRLILRGYRERPATSYLLMRVTDAAAARTWIGRLAEATAEANRLADEDARQLDAHLARASALIGTAHPAWRREDNDRVRGLRLMLAFTHRGLERLGLPAQVLETFIPEFRQGMTAPHRSRVLGDIGSDAPEHWRWGSDDSPVDMLCAVFAGSHGELESTRLDATLGLRGAGLEVFERIGARLSFTEPFGFADGLSQPRIEGAGTARVAPMTRWDNSLPAGEFLLGHRNAYEQLPVSPYVVQEPPGPGVLPRVPGQRDRWDFGRNGSFIAMRQLSQDVEGFSRFTEGQARRDLGDRAGGASEQTLRDAEERVGARMVGRWRSGTPLELAPEWDDPTHRTENDFAYAKEDREGARCPIGAHVRRSNPRDSRTDEAIGVTPEVAMERVNHHRILRRSRVYPAKPGEDGETGIVFLAYNTNLERQFEFVQQSWSHNAHFDGLHDERDPLMPGAAGADNTMTVQRQTLATRMRGLSEFVKVRGGAYFFMPGLRALAHLAGIS